MYDSSNISSEEKLQEWNNEVLKHLLPDTIILILYIIVGITGNGFVLFVYKFRFRSLSEERFFIPYLAAIDIFACTSCSSFGIYVNLRPVHFINDLLCKVFCTSVMFSTGCSVLTLLIIAIQRYLKICKPFGRQITRKRLKICLLLDLMMALVMSVPVFKFYGTVRVYSEVWQTTGSRCTSIINPNSKLSALVYKGVLMLMCVGILVTLCVLYSLIGKTICKQTKTFKKSPVIPEASSSGLSNETTKTSNIDSKMSEGNVTREVEQQIPIKSWRHCSVKSPRSKLSLVFCVITTVYVVVFIPKVAMMLYESRYEHFWLNLTESELGGYRFLYTLYIINNVVNPFIYGFFDTKFRKEFTSIICKRSI